MSPHDGVEGELWSRGELHIFRHDWKTFNIKWPTNTWKWVRTKQEKTTDSTLKSSSDHFACSVAFADFDRLFHSMNRLRITHYHCGIDQHSSLSFDWEHRATCKTLCSFSKACPVCAIWPSLWSGVFWPDTNGKRWLPNLKTLRFTAFDGWRQTPGNYQEVEEQFDTFRTPFWLQEHQWYVCCDWEGDPSPAPGYKHFYTLPYAFNYFADSANGIRWSTSTCSHLDKHWSFHHVRKFECRSTDTNRQYQYPVGFLHIENLQLSIPQPDSIWRMIPSLNHLTKLYVTVCEGESDSWIQMLIERARRLGTLLVGLMTTISKTDVLFRVRNPSVRQIRFLPYVRCPWPDFDQARCTAFVQSPLASRCEFLEIRVSNPECIFTLINGMAHLRSMVVHLADDFPKIPRPTVAGFTEWARNHLPRRFWISSCERHLLFRRYETLDWRTMIFFEDKNETKINVGHTEKSQTL